MNIAVATIAALLIGSPAMAQNLEQLEPGRYLILKLDEQQTFTPVMWYCTDSQQRPYKVTFNDQAQPIPVRQLFPNFYGQAQPAAAPHFNLPRALSALGPRSHAAYYGYTPAPQPSVVHQMPGLLQALPMQQVPPLQMATPQTQLYSNGSQFGSATTFGNSTLLNGPLFQGR